MSRLTTLAATAALVLIPAAHAIGQQGQTGAQTSPAQQRMGQATDKSLLADRDEDFLKHAAQANKVELAASKLAVAKATNPDVKAFAEKLIADHTATDRDLAPFITSKKVMLSDDDADYKMKMSKHESLQKLTGAEFDKEYLEDMISDHENAIVLFSNEALKSKDAALKAWAEKTVPALREHLKTARDLRDRIGK